MSISFKRTEPTDDAFFAMWQDKVYRQHSENSAPYLNALTRHNHQTPGFFVRGSDENGAILLMAYVDVLRVVGFLGLSYTVVSLSGLALWFDQSAASHQDAFPPLLAFLRRNAPHSILRFDFLEHQEDRGLIDFCRKSLGLSIIFAGDLCYVDLDRLGDYTQYLATLEKKDRWFAKKVDKVAAEQGVALTFTQDYEPHLDRMYELYRSVHDRATEIVYPPEKKEFFAFFAREKIPGRTTLLAIRHGTPVGFMMLSENDRILTCDYCGIDHSLVKEINTWYLLMLNAIRRAVDSGKQRIMLGTTNFPMKKKLGAQKHELYVAVGFPNPVMRFFFQRLLRGVFYKIYTVRKNNELADVPAFAAMPEREKQAVLF